MSSAEDFDAEAAAAVATGEDPDVATVTDDHASAEGVEPSNDVGSTSTLRDMLMSTEPSKPLDQVEAPYDPERGGTTRIFRGVQKAMDVDGLPAVADILIGFAELFQVLENMTPEEREDVDDVDEGGQPGEVV